ncbi:MAG: glycosyltransferase family 2 protein [Bacteroidales bacterium]
MNQAEILIIGVIYNTYPETLRYLESFGTTENGQLLLILVDNSVGVAPREFTEKIGGYPFLHYLKTGRNAGYFGGASVGLQHYLEEHSGYPRWILVTNVDIVFTPGFFSRLLNIADKSNLGMVAPSIISKRWHSDYNPKILERYSRKKLLFYQLLYSSFLFHNLFLVAAYLKKWIKGKKTPAEKAGNDNQSGRKIYAPHGSCLVFHRNYFLRGGNLDLPNFLFGEEVLVAENVLNSGLDVIYHPKLVVYDYEHASIGFFVTPAINKYYAESNRAILENYYKQ